MREALIEVLTWAAVFEHTLSTEEVHRYLSVNTDINEVKLALSSFPEIIFSDGMWHLKIAPPNSIILNQRRLNSKKHLNEVKGALAILCRSSAVEGVAITGSVAAGVNDDQGDVDILIIAKAGHLWRVRALAIHLQHQHQGGMRICPNMVLDQRNLELRPSKYAAREMAMMIPIKGRHSFKSLLDENPWWKEMLPNAKLRTSHEIEFEGGKVPWWWYIMRFPIAGALAERWESKRRIQELTQGSKSEETVYELTRCLGHEHAHRTRIENRIQELEKEVEG